MRYSEALKSAREVSEAKEYFVVDVDEGVCYGPLTAKEAIEQIKVSSWEVPEWRLERDILVFKGTKVEITVEKQPVVTMKE